MPLGHYPGKMSYRNNTFSLLNQNTQKSVEQTDKTTSTHNVIPIQPNYHVLNQLKTPYTSEQLHQDAWEYIFTGKAPKFDNPEDKTAFALKVADLKMWTGGG